MSLDEFVEELALVRASNPREPDAPPDDSANAVKVMTVHSAKGLEFPVVFVAALAQRRGNQSAGGGLLAAHRAGRALAQSRADRERDEKDDLVPARPAARNAAGARARRATGCSTSP